MKKIKIISVSLFVLISLLLLVSPFLVKPLLEKNSKEWLGRKITIENFKLNYFTGTLKMVGFKMYEQDETATFVSFDTLLLDVVPYQYFTSKIVVEKLYLKSLKTSIVKENDTVFNFDSLISFFERPKDTIQKKEATKDFKFSFSNIEFVNATLAFNDLVVRENFELHAINFFIPNIEWNQRDKSKADLEFSFSDGGVFTSSTQFDPGSGDFSAQIGIQSLDISSFEKYLKTSLEIDVLEGFLNTQLSFDGNTNNIDKLLVEGTVALSDFSLTDTAKKTVLSFDDLHCPILKIAPLENSFHIGDVVLEKPFVNYEKYKTTSNLELLVKNNTSEKKEKKQVKSNSNPTEKLYYSVASLQINKGSAALQDATTSKPFQYMLTGIDVKLAPLNSNTTWLKTHSELVLNHTGKLILDFNFNPTKVKKEMEMEYDISGLKLKDMNIYAVDYMGIPIYKGEMYYKAKTSVFDGMLKSENKVIVHNISLGEKNGGEYNIPMKFAVFLLKDKHGVVRMDVPVEGNVEKSDVDVKGIIWDAFKNLIIKTASSPGKLLGGMVGSKKEDLEAIRYSYLDTTLSIDQLKQIKALRSIRKKKKGLEVSLNYMNSVENEKRHIAVDLIKKEYLKKEKLDKINNKEEFVNYVNEKTKTTNLSLEDACMQLVSVKKINSLAIEYNSKRVAAVENYLNRIDPKHPIKVNVADDLTQEELQAPPIFLIQYTMIE